MRINKIYVCKKLETFTERNLKCSGRDYMAKCISYRIVKRTTVHTIAGALRIPPPFFTVSG